VPDWRERYAAVETQRTRLSMAPLARVRTIEDRTAGANLRAIGSAWTREVFGGPFFETPPDGGLSTGVVFVRSRDGDTETRNPGALGGGTVDEHLIYEGLSRVAADAAVAGAGTLHSDAFFTVWHPELVELRRTLGLPRHPSQVIMSADGSVNPDELLLFNVPDVPVYVLTSASGGERLARALAARPWMTAVVAASLPEQFAILHAAGIRRVCSVGGRRSATALVDAGLVRDVYLTTTSATGAEPRTPWYIGRQNLQMATVLVKAWDGVHGPVRFEHDVLFNPSSSSRSSRS
jgi:riboflavin biosynthesis pyrimidine reductase